MKVITDNTDLTRFLCFSCGVLFGIFLVVLFLFWKTDLFQSRFYEVEEIQIKPVPDAYKYGLGGGK